jgi:predicted dehydrogenase
MAAQLGQPQLLFCHQRSTAHGTATEARWSNMRNLVEAVDWCRFVVGREPTSVLGLAHEAPNGRPLEDYQMMSLDFSTSGLPGSGPIAQISCGRYIHTSWHEAPSFRPPADLQVACQHGVAFIDLPSTLIWFDSAGRHMETMESERPVGELLLMHFHRAVTSLIRDTSSLEDAYRAVWVALQAQVSRVEGRRVSLAVAEPVPRAT